MNNPPLPPYLHMRYRSRPASHLRGHKIIWISEWGIWVYSDTLSPADDSRSCIRCERMPIADLPDDSRRDACMGAISGATSACCGHGIVAPNIVYEDGRRYTPLYLLAKTS